MASEWQVEYKNMDTFFKYKVRVTNLFCLIVKIKVKHFKMRLNNHFGYGFVEFL